MILLVTGGSASGKSEYAENRALQLAKTEQKKLIYLAAMKPFGEEAAKRIERHRQLRAGKGFETVERFWAIFSFVIFPLSGVFFKVDSLSPKTQEIVLAFPMIHGTEMIRHGYFGAQMKTHESISYLVICNVIMTFIGLILVKKYSQGVEPS